MNTVSNRCHWSLSQLRMLVVAWVGFSLTPVDLRADGPEDNIPAKVRQIPPPGIELSQNVIQELRTAAASIRQRTANSKLNPQDRCEVEVVARAIDMALDFLMFYSDQEVDHARQLIKLAEQRIEQSESGNAGNSLLFASSKVQSGKRLIVGGFRSKLDDSIQPYGLVLPEDMPTASEQPVRLDIWLHGRDEKTSEVEFLHRRQNQIGEFAPPNTIVLHPYGRYSNAFKFAGEIDVLEAIEHVKSRFVIDPNRINIRGFSMGGAGCWQMAVHYPGIWCTATPGAGFSETTQFLEIFQKEKFQPAWFQARLLHWYDCPDWSANLRNLPLVAYSGELDRQKQAADVMQQALRARDISMTHIIGPQTEHKYHPDAKVKIEEWMTEQNAKGRTEFPTEIDLTTYSLRYNQWSWMTIDALEEHWREARVRASVTDASSLKISASNVAGLTIRFPKEQPLLASSTIHITLDGTSLKADWQQEPSGRSIRIAKLDSKWQVQPAQGQGPAKVQGQGPVKRHGLQGPIDDAFMSPFLFVVPDQESQESATETAVDRWARRELDHAMHEWRRHFRGDAVVRKVSELTPSDIADKNLILFGTPMSHPLIAKIAQQLPIQWRENQIVIRRGPGQGRETNEETFDATKTAVAMIYPNPLNPERYVVLNSGFTFREFAYLNNARQIAMLPDWALIDAEQGADSQKPGLVRAAGFFDEKWEFQPVSAGK